MATKYLDSNGLLYFWQKIKSVFVTDVTYNSSSKKIQKTKNGTASDVVTLSTVATSGSYNDLTDIPSLINDVQVNGTSIVEDGIANVPVASSSSWGAIKVSSAATYDDNYSFTNLTYALNSQTTNSASMATTALVTTSKRGLMSKDDKTKLDAIASGAEVNVQSDWSQSDNTKDDYIKNKPTIPTLQNVFGKVKVGTTTIEADTTQDTLELAAGSNITLTPDTTNDKVTIASSYTDTKNTAGSTDSSSKLFLVGATSQAANPQTYSHDSAYVGTDGHLYSNSVQVVNLSGSQALTNKTYNGYTLGAACAKGVVTSISSDSADVPTVTAVKNYVATAVTGATAFQGTAPTTFAPTNYLAGYYWVVGTAGTYAGQTCEAGDMIFATNDYASAYSASDFDVIQTNLDITSISNADIDTIVAA